MSEKIQIQKISSNRKFIVLEDNTKVELPSWLKKRYRSMRYLNEEKILQVNCYKCKKWFDILELSENIEWIDIHTNTEIKFTRSGFSSYCQICSTSINMVGNTEVISKNSNGIPTPISQMEKDTIFLTPENLKYVKLRVALNDIRKADFYNHLIEKEKELNPISKFL